MTDWHTVTIYNRNLSFNHHFSTAFYVFVSILSIRDSEEYTKWNSFVDSIKSKLTVKQVVDGVRSGGRLSFDYLLLIITAE